MRKTSTRYESNQYYGYNSRNQSVGVVDYTNQYPNYVTGNMDFVPKVMSLRETNIRFYPSMPMLHILMIRNIPFQGV